MPQLSIFVSHSTKYADIAKSFKRSLLRVKSSRELSVKLSEDMPTGREWRKWIDDNVRGADAFVLLYPHPSMDMSWCNYELGRFYQGRDNVVCIRNVNIPIPPPAFEPYQSVKADRVGLMKFMEDLFVTGALTKGEVLNENVDKVSSEDGTLASQIARELAEKFAEALVETPVYERSLVMSVNYASPGKLDAENSMIEGTQMGVNLLGFQLFLGMKWSDIRGKLITLFEWPAELEQAMAKMASGEWPSPLSPFRSPSSSEIFIPVIVKAEIVDREVRRVFVIFVPADSERLGPLFEGSSLPMGMPAPLASLVHVLRLIFRARWDILEPLLTEATFKKPSTERCAEIARLVLSDYDVLNGELASLHLGSLAAFHAVFDRDLWEDVDACSNEWVTLTDELKEKPPSNAEELSSLLTALQSNNAKWMNIGAKQFTKTVAECCVR